jgi:putative nucleotidyltransferase with HDIG domain
MSARNIILAVGVTEVFVPRDPWERSLWRHALQVAILSRSIAIRANHADLDPDEVYTCALLHDVGRFVMFRLAPTELRMIDEGDWKTPEALVAKEVEVCGLTHPQIGALACEHWHLPPTIVDVIRDHHKSASVLSSMRVGRLTALIRFADLAMFPSAMPGTPGLAQGEDCVIEEIVAEAMPSFLRLSAPQLRELLVEAEALAERICIGIGIA